MSTQIIAAIAGSAGCYRPLEEFFDHTPHDDVSFVVLRHFPSDYKSRLQNNLSGHSRLRVRDIREGMSIARDTVYIAPPAMYITLRDGTFQLQPRHETVNRLADIFLCSLAEQYRDRAIGIVLSGAHWDGTAGIRAIHKAGGMTFAQPPGGAEFSSMPESAIKTGMIDYVLEPAEIAKVLHQQVEWMVRSAQQHELK